MSGVRIQQVIQAVLIVAVIVLLGWLSHEHAVKLDWTANQRNTITDGSRKQLSTMADPLKFVAFTYPGAEDRAYIEYQVDKYKRFKPDTELEWVDPSADPMKVKDYGVSFAGQVAVEYQGRRELLSQLDEAGITGALQRLSYSGDTWVVFLEGHGERDLEGQENDAYGRFAQVLRDKGLKVQRVNLVASPKIPDNASVLVIASPQQALFDGEIKLIQDWVAQGGNLLWLSDPEVEPGLAPLARSLGIDWLPGFAIFPDYQLIGTGHPGIFAALDYPSNPVTQGLDTVTLFPFVRALNAEPPAGWQLSPMLTTSDSAWRETGPIDQGSVSYDPNEDGAGPLTIGATLTREVPAADSADTGAASTAAATSEDAPPKTVQQRIAVIGDADFLSNGFVGQGGNQQLGLNLIQWLARRDGQLDIDVPKAPDLDLALPAWGLTVLTLVFVILLPLVLIGIGVGRWASRRRR